RKPVADAALIACLGFLNISQQEKCALARGDSDRSFGCRPGLLELASIKCCPSHCKLGLDVVEAQLSQSTRTLQSIMGRIAMPQVNVDVGDVRMWRTLPDCLQHLCRLGQIIEADRGTRQRDGCRNEIGLKAIGFERCCTRGSGIGIKLLPRPCRQKPGTLPCHDGSI